MLKHARPRRSHPSDDEPNSGHERRNHSTTTGLPTNVAAALACIPLVGGIIFYVLEKTDAFVRFYAMQSIIFGGAWIIFDIVARDRAGGLRHHPGDRRALRRSLGIIWAIVTIGFLIVFVITVIKAFTRRALGDPIYRTESRDQVDGRRGLTEGRASARLYR